MQEKAWENLLSKTYRFVKSLPGWSQFLQAPELQRKQTENLIKQTKGKLPA